MCGIAGVAYRDPRRPVDLAIARAMVDAIRHRGPDGDGWYSAPGVALGMCRLSIIDPEGGDQPLHDESGRIAVVHNGELYNYRELRESLAAKGHTLRTRSDTEVAAHLYEDLGERFPTALNGMFAIALFDARARRLVLARDRVGEKPLFLYEDAEKLVFGSEIKALLASGLVTGELDPAAIHDYLSFNFVPPPGTAFRGIRHLPPATTVVFDQDGTRERRYWRLEPRAPAGAGELRALLEDSVSLRLRADVPVGVYLSGGVDSSAIAWAVARANGEPVRAFHVAFPGTRHDERAGAAAVARGLSLPLDVVAGDASLYALLEDAQRHADQPHGDASFLPMLALARRAREHVKVVLTGEGADEIFGGYSWSASAPYNTHDPWEAVRARFEASAVFTAEGKAALCAEPLGRRDSAELLRATLADAPELDPLSETLYADFALLLPGNNLVKADRMGMAFGVELRCPFLDHRLIELAFGLAGEAKVSGGVGKRALREALRDVLPDGAAERPKRLFALPAGEWLRGRASALLDRLVERPAPPLDRWLRRDAVARLAAEHRAGIDHGRKLRALVALDAWARTLDQRAEA